MKNIFLWLLGISMTTLWVFNFSAGIVGGIWLLATGGWGLVVAGLLLSFVMPWVYSIAFLPTMLMAPLLIKATESGSRFWASVLGIILAGYQYFIMALWVTYIFGWMVLEGGYSPIALTLWGYSVVMGPIGYMASKEDADSTGTTLGVLFTQFSYIVLAINYFAGGSVEQGNSIVWIFLIIFVILIVSVLNLVLSKKAGAAEIVAPLIDEENKHTTYLSRLFNGRLNRINFLIGNIIVYAAVIALAFVLNDMFYNVAAYTIIIVYSLSLYIRRLHDLGKSGWYVLMGIIPIINFILLIWLLLARGANTVNKFGEPPLKGININKSLAFK